jgi:hypothetical protein
MRPVIARHLALVWQLPINQREKKSHDQSLSGETIWHKLLKREFKESAIGGANSFMMRQRGLYTNNMNVEPVAVIIR